MTVTRTSDPHPTDAFLLRVRRGEGGWVVTDSATTRYGHGATPAEALGDWCDDVTTIASLREPLGMPIAAEADWARAILTTPSSTTEAQG